MSKIRLPLRHYLVHHCSANKLSRLFGGSHNTWTKRIRKLESKAFTLEQFDTLGDTDLELLVSRKTRNSRKVRPDWAVELAYMRLGYNLSEAHIRYQDIVGEVYALAYSSYCQEFRKHQKTIDPVFRHIHVPGEAKQTDYAGYTPVGLLENGNEGKFQLFVAAFPFSHFLFAKLSYTQNTNDHIDTNIASLEYAGGAPDIIIPDNLKAAVIYARPYSQRVLNSKYVAFADQYEMQIRPARVRKPKDKASVELAVKLIQRQLRLHLIGRPLMTLPDMNILLREIVDRWNDKKMKRSGGITRREKFEKYEKPYLKELPLERPEFLDLPVTRQVDPDYHIAFDSVRYSVPFRLIGKSVTVRASERFVEIRYDNKEAVRHKRSHIADGFVTKASHRPDNHRAYLAGKLEEWAERQVPEICEWVLASMSSRWGQRDKDRRLSQLRKMIRIYGQERIVQAIQQAKSADISGYKYVREMLENNMEAEDIQTFSHSRRKPKLNVRGPAYFEGGSNVH